MKKYIYIYYMYRIIIKNKSYKVMVCEVFEVGFILIVKQLC